MSSVFAPKTYKHTLSVLNLNLMTSCRYMSIRQTNKMYNIHTLQSLYVFYLNCNNKICFSVKLGEGLCISS